MSDIIHCYVMQESEIPAVAECLTKAFEGYPLFEYFADGNYDHRKYRIFWESSIKAAGENLVCLIDNAQSPSAVAMFVRPEAKDAGILTYLKSGGAKIIYEFGLPLAKRMLSFETFAGKIKAKYASEKCWYLYGFATLKEKRNSGLGSSLIRPMLERFDRDGEDCYLETLDEQNVPRYEHYGFELVETADVKDSDLKTYCMLRKARK